MGICMHFQQALNLKYSISPSVMVTIAENNEVLTHTPQHSFY
jgi:hypothetical protein